MWKGDYIKERNSAYVGIHDFHLMWEHKKNLKKVIEYINNSNIMNYSVDVTWLEEIEELTLIARNLILKDRIKKTVEEGKKVIEIYDKVVKIEEKNMKELLGHL